MCGLVGIYVKGNKSIHLDKELEDMSSRIVHRGPDSDGIWSNKAHNIGFAHRRLAIHDLSPLGHQPKISSSGRYVIAFNGEIYNFLELAKELQQIGFVFEGNSDTEIMLAAFEAWGIDAALKKFVGMFAFSLWDDHKKILFLARDRLGEKPLYYGWQNNSLIFGSELKALRAFSGWQGGIDRNALSLYVRHNYIPAPHSIYKNIRKVIPGTYLKLDVGAGSKNLTEHVYWSINKVFANQPTSQKYRDKQTALDELDNLLLRSVSDQMISDVPLGAFLSGGIDSSLIVSLMQESSTKPVKTFTIGFNEAEFNEAERAKDVAQHLGTDHAEMYVSSQDALDVIPKIPVLYDEPFADSSQIPTYLVSHFARQNVTVSLSGDGGDELFCGYTRYFEVLREWEKVNSGSKGLRSHLARINSHLPNELLNSSGAVCGRFIRRDVASFGDRLKQRLSRRSSSSLQELYRKAVSYWSFPSDIVIDGKDSNSYLSDPDSITGINNDYHQLMVLDAGSYLPDDILTKVDRAAMAVSLEGRIPFLDHRIVELASKIPIEFNIQGHTGKHMLKELLYKRVPKQLVDRPKAGFAVPIAEWLRGPLRDWAEVLINTKRIESDGYFIPKIVERKWNEHLSGQYDWSFHLWGILTFQSWLTHESSGSPML